MEDSTRLFRKAAFGGFNKDDVMDYIESMKREFFNYKTKVEQTIQELNEKLAALEAAGDGVTTAQAQPAADEESSAALDIHAATDHLKQVADELCSNLSRLISRISPSDAIVETVETPAPEIAQEAEQDPVAQVLSQLYAAPESPRNADASAPKTQRSMIASVLPSYLFED